jgi:phage terminase large subunit-like protein
MEDSWISPPEWDAISSPSAELKPDEKITLGFDGSKSRDHTALVACRISDGLLVPLRVWDPKLWGGEIPRDDVDALVTWAMAYFHVVAFRADVKEFEAHVDMWTREYGRKMKIKAAPGHPIAFDMRGRKRVFALDCESFVDSVLAGEISHDGSVVLRQHVLNAHRFPLSTGEISIRKKTRENSRKIDAAVAAVLAFGARRDYLRSRHRGGVGVIS